MRAPANPQVAAPPALHPHQRQGVDWLLGTPRALLADDVGLGKTITVLGAICALLDRGHIPHSQARVVWVTQAPLVEPTRAKIQRFAPHLNVVTQHDPLGRLDAKAQIALRYDRDGWDVYIVSYEFLTGIQRGLPKILPGTTMWVLDEAMALKGAGVKQQAIRELSAKADRVVAMTATPYENDPLETHAVLRALNAPGLWPQGVFENEFVEWRPAYNLPNGANVPAAPLGLLDHKIEEVRDYLDGIMLRRTADDIGLQLPTRVGEHRRWVPLTTAQQADYDKAARTPGLTAHARRQKASRVSRDQSSLVDAMLDEVRQRPGEKIIVACETLNVVHLAAERLAAAGIGNRVIEGADKLNEREQAIADVRDRHDTQVLIGSSVLERGLDLQFARVLISLDTSYNPQRSHQLEGRIRRLGSPHQTHEFLTLLPDTPQTRDKIATSDRRTANAHALGLSRN